MPRPNDLYYDRVQLPIFLGLICLVWIVVGVRLWVFRKHYCGWRTWRGLSTALTLLSAVMCTIYVAMLAGNYFLNERIIRIRDIISPNPATYEMDRKPESYSAAEIQTVIDASEEIYMLQLWLRITLSIALWLVKFAFVALFLETREALSHRWRIVLYITAATISVTFVVVIWTVCKDVIQSWVHPTVEDILGGIYVNGIRFVALEADNEFVLTAANIITDILLVLIACKTVTALHRPISAASLLFIMVAITVSVAIGRLILNILTMNVMFYSDHATIPLQLLAELETFFAAIVSCLPGLRVLLRSSGNQQEEEFVENEVIVPSHEMLDIRDSTRFSEVTDAKYSHSHGHGHGHSLHSLHSRPGSEDPFTNAKAPSSGSGSYTIARQVSMA
ncbi:hypothetical protein BZA05DRAFT_411626 [Tricharina praecox]|uniref:uncharacterized protein n=1 Tax=Tricharina praecox TaxID=43433 RepID=UPI00222065DD|nr:uncharacterized protein BZA05DRAFT_411626 [Tricharina praecox]KAI5842843.1 hypothetical protein BZA05DRAFT_411626 [Tricharina praecox]